MANQALAALESALRDRKLDRTLTTALPPLERSDPAALAASQVPALDEALRGGLPRGQVSELAAAPAAGLRPGARTAGRTTLLLHIVAATTQRGELAALVDTADRLDVASAAAAGVAFERLLWIRGDSGPLERGLERALKALGLVLQAGGFGLVAIDLADVPAAALRSLPFTTWLRIQRTIEGSDTACLLVVPEPLARSAGGVTLMLSGAARWDGAADRSRRLAALDVTVRIASPRRRADGTVCVAATTSGSY
jgi:hypothetical protein